MVNSDSNPCRSRLQAWSYWSCPLAMWGCSVFVVALAVHRHNPCTQEIAFCFANPASAGLNSFYFANSLSFFFKQENKTQGISCPPPSWNRWGQVLWLWPATFSQLFCVKLCSSHHRVRKHTQTHRFQHRTLYCCREEEGASEQRARVQEIKHS